LFIKVTIFLLVDEIAPAENGISGATTVVSEVDDYDHYNITIDRMALASEDSVQFDGSVSPNRFPFENYFNSCDGLNVVTSANEVV